MFIVKHARRAVAHIAGTCYDQPFVVEFPKNPFKNHMITPMVARLVRDPFDRDGWLFELKCLGSHADNA